MSKDNEFDWKTFENEAITRLLKGDELSGSDGILTPLIQRLLQASVDGEMQAHVAENRPNRGNGSKSKQVKSTQGLLHIDMPSDRDASFDSQLVPKRKTSLGEGLDNNILALYGLGMSYSDIRTHLAEMYGLNVSEAALTAITDKVMDELHAWQTRTLDEFYAFVWLDAIHYKVRHEGRVITRALYTVLGINLHGRKELLGLYLGEHEGARFCQQWEEKYPLIVKSWITHWDQLMEMFEYPEEIRRIIYTTNPVEGVHRQLRKTTKTKGAFVSDQALLKIIFLTYKRISAKWTNTPHNWGLTLQKLLILFPDRINPYYK